MKKTKNWLKYAYILLPAVIFAFVFIPPVNGLCADANPAQIKAVDIQSADDDGITIEFTLPSFELKEINGPDRIYKRINIKGWGRTSRVGAPELPVTGLLLQVPSSGDIQLQILENTHKSLQDINIYPVPRLKASDNGTALTEFAKDNALYNTPEFYPAVSAKIGKRGILRGTSVARLLFCPFRWNPVTGQLQYSKKIRIRINFQNPNTSSPTALSLSSKKTATQTESSRSRTFELMKKNLIFNYKTDQDNISNNALKSPVTRTAMAMAAPAQYLKIEINEAGIYRVTYSDMVTAGLDPATVDPATFQLFNMGNEVAVKVYMAKEAFSSGDYIEFYGEGIDNIYTGTNVYQLYWGVTNGARVTQVDGAVTGGHEKRISFFDTIKFEENNTLVMALTGNPDEDTWFWEKLTAQVTKQYTLNIYSPVETQTNATVKVFYRGDTDTPDNPDHHTVISLNGSEIGNNTWDGKIEYTQESGALSSGLLTDGNNTLSIQLPGDTEAVVDTVYFNRVEVNYERYLKTVQDKLKFSIEGSGIFEAEITGLGESDPVIYDITDPSAPVEIINAAVTQDQNYKANFESQVSGKKNYFISTAGAIMSPAQITLRTEPDLKNTSNGADYIIVAPEEFMTSVEPLSQLRQAQGMRVKKVSVEDIYAQFSFGLFTPRAIKDFIIWAYGNWVSPAPAYVLFAGDANMDYRDYSGTGKQNKAPVHLSFDTQFGQTPDDNWYGCVQEDDIFPDIFIGRISGQDSNMVAGIVNKIVAYENNDVYKPEKVLLIADDDDPDFQNLDEDLTVYLPSSFSADKVYLASYGDDVAGATADIVSGINSGELITNYVGHGDVTHWAGERLFYSYDPTAVPPENPPSSFNALNNEDKLTFVLMMNCRNGFFAHMAKYSLAEQFVIHPDKGAVAVYAPSGLGYLFEHSLLDKEIFSSIFENKNLTIGPVTTQAKIAAYAKGFSPDAIQMFNLIGDPATRLRMDILADVDGSGSTGLEDAVLALKILANMAITADINPDGDIDGDGKIGLAESIYVLQYIAGIKD